MTLDFHWLSYFKHPNAFSGLSMCILNSKPAVTLTVLLWVLNSNMSFMTPGSISNSFLHVAFLNDMHTFSYGPPGQCEGPSTAFGWFSCAAPDSETHCCGEAQPEVSVQQWFVIPAALDTTEHCFGHNNVVLCI